MRSIAILILILFLSSCAKKNEEKVLEAIDVAQSYLSESKCNDAIDVLEDVGRQNSNAIYLQVLASAYACRAGLDAVTFIADDVPAINTATLLNSLSTLTFSDDTETDSDAYQDIRTALNILLEADGGIQPSQTNRTAAFGPRKAGDMGIQILILSIVQLGKFLNHYGNVDSAGTKGAGTGTNSCFLDYSYATAQVAVTAGATSCTVFNDGHSDLSLIIDLADTKRRLCEGMVLITNIIDVLDNIDLSGSTELSSLEDIATAASQIKDDAIAAAPELATLLNMTSQSVCETTLDTASELENMQLIYAIIFESGLE